MGVAIKSSGLGKSYDISHEVGDHYETLRDVITKKSAKIFNVFDRSSSNHGREVEKFWALDDISFEIKQGEKVGIIGRNGAGKSTLLKVLSRITEPTKGSVGINGRISSLLEVGTGFHPELTGRENVFLNGAILGMSRVEIKSKFEEIVEFAEIEKFLDTPVKRYSSGMYVRLAFAVAAHLEPEIFIIDEVLAVGDAVFQKKCLNKMHEVSEGGATILFVSHNIGAINALCNKAMLLEQGKLIEFGDVEPVIARYMRDTASNTGCEYINDEIDPSARVSLIEASINDADDKPSHSLFIDQDSAIRLVWRLNETVDFMRFGVEVIDSRGTVIFSSMDTDSTGLLGKQRESGVYSEIMKIPAYLLMPGLYSVKVFAGMPGVERYMEMDNLLQFEVVDNQSHISHVRGEVRNGFTALPMQWEVQYKDA